MQDKRRGALRVAAACLLALAAARHLPGAPARQPAKGPAAAECRVTGRIVSS